MDAISAAPIASGVSALRGRGIAAVAARARVAVGFGFVPFLEVPFVAGSCGAAPFADAPFADAPFFLARGLVAAAPAAPPGAARRVDFRAGRGAGVDCAGSSARVRGATIVLKV
jgi:hypothetical protein